MNNEEGKNFNINGWWKGRSKLEQKLIGSLIVIVSVLIALLLFIIIKHTAAPRICKTADCITAASQIIAHVDPNIDPCDDFFKFACGKFLENTHGDIKASSILRQTEQVERQISEMLKEPIKETDLYWVKREKKMFNACLNETELDREEALSIFKETLMEVNGWPVLEGNNWKERLFDWKEIIYKLKRKGYPYKMMLAVDVTSDLPHTNQYIIRISEPYVQRIKEENKSLYKQYMIDISLFFGANKGRAESDMGKVFNFMEKLRKVADKNDWDNNTEFNLENIKNSSRFIIKQFQAEHVEIDWLEFINNVIDPVAQLTPDNYALFPKTEFLNGFFDLIYKTDKRIIANYIIWRVVEEIIPYIPENARQIKKNYTCLMDNLRESDKDRFQFCKKELTMSFYPRPVEIMYARKYLTREQRDNVKKLVASIKEEFTLLLSRTSWMDEETKRKALEKVNATVEIIGGPRNYFHDSAMVKVPSRDEDINEENSENVTFIELILKNNIRLYNAHYFHLHMEVNDTKLDQYFRFISTVGAMYSIEDNVIVLPAAILQGVFYDAYRPMYLNYGAIGAIIGHELTHGFTRAASKYDKDNSRERIWSNYTEAAFEERIKCMIQEADNFTIGESERKVNGTLTLEENIADYTGLKVSYAAYKKWVQENGEEPALPTINYTPYQLFWIAAVSYECFHDFESTKKVEPHAHNSFRVIAPIRNNPDFSKDFSCSVGSKMNPIDKCQVF